jgi:hypothetical protein
MSLPLPNLTFYRMPDQSPATANIQGLLDALFTALGSVVDYRGTSLASTHLWTVGRQQVTGTTMSVYLTPPAGSVMTFLPGLILAGSSSASTPTMASPDVFTASNLLFGITKTPGAYNDWVAAAPFTSGSFSGFWRGAGTTWNATSAVVRCYVSEEVIIVQLIGATVTQQAWMGLGAIVEPHTTYVASSGVDAEIDDRLYGFWTSGQAAMLTNWLNFNTSTAPFGHNTTAGNTHCAVFQPATGSLYTCGRKAIFASAGSTAENVTNNSVFVSDLMGMCRTSGSTAHNGARLGFLRGVYPIGLIQSGRTIRNGSTDLYHAISTDTTTAADAIIIPAAP